ncbi:MAG: hypothetical protein OEX04_12730 [Acidimicrobiia bacterium]|nr:hypothetical protein [Acidimicrobiia bacterium]MDH4308334.1 hypothetical protein [Acidimicrobiia bacterium]MDH5293605.1 hypothetical protein [Acidimicrobiia bacterium]
MENDIIRDPFQTAFDVMIEEGIGFTIVCEGTCESAGTGFAA